MIDQAMRLLRELVDPEPCRYVNGFCQTHSLHLAPCPHQRAKLLIAGQEEHR